MAKVRDATVGFQGPGKKIERVSVTVPADWISGDRAADVELRENEKLNTRLSVVGSVLWVEISEAYEPIAGFRVQ